MTCLDISNIVEGTIRCGDPEKCTGIEKAFASDLMSDVLTVDTDHLILITGLATVQTIRTALMSDICCILFVRGKEVSQAMQDLAIENGICLIETRFSMFRACGLLHNAGLRPIY